MAQIAREVERHYPHPSLRDRRLENFEPTIASSIAEAATRASAELKIPYIVTGTTTGNTAHHLAAFRPQARIVALTPEPRVARRLALLWGTESLLIEPYASIDVLLYMTERHMVREGLVRSGDLIAFTTGMPVGSGGTNVLKIHQIPSVLPHPASKQARAWRSAASCDSPESIRAISASRSFAPAIGAHDDRRLELSLDLVENVVTVGPGRELREMRHANDLPASRELADRRADRGGRCAADAGVDLVENQRAARIAGVGENDDQREQHARELAARRDARERARRLAGVGSEEKLDALGAVRADALERLDRHLEAARGKRDLGELGDDSFAEPSALRARAAHSARPRRRRAGALRLALRPRVARCGGRVLRTRRRSRARRAPAAMTSSTVPPYFRVSRSIRSRRELIASSSAGSYSAASSARATSAARSTASACSVDARCAVSRSVASNFATPESATAAAPNAPVAPRFFRGQRFASGVQRHRDALDVIEIGTPFASDDSISLDSNRASSISRTVKHASS